MLTRRPAFRATALLGAGAFALHELSYSLDPPAGVAGAGHGYLAVVAPLIALAVVVAAGQFLGHLARAVRTGEPHPEPRRSPVRLWLAAAAALLVVYGVQETTEGLLAGGHSADLGILLGSRILWAPILALALGALIALALRGADAAIALAVRRPRREPKTTAGTSRLRPPAIDLARRGPIALKLAGRAPPLASL